MLQWSIPSPIFGPLLRQGKVTKQTRTKRVCGSRPRSMPSACCVSLKESLPSLLSFLLSKTKGGRDHLWDAMVQDTDGKKGGRLPQNLGATPPWRACTAPYPLFLSSLHLLILQILFLHIQHWRGCWDTAVCHPGTVPALLGLVQPASQRVHQEGCPEGKAQWATGPWPGSPTPPAVRAAS